MTVYDVRIGYDIDDVLTRTSELVIEGVNFKLGTDYTLDDFVNPVIEDCFGLTTEEVNEIFSKPGNKRFPDDLAPFEGAKDVVNSYHGLVDSQYFITARDPSFREATIRWFDDNGFLYDPRNISFKGVVGEFSLDNTAERKAQTVKDLGIVFFVEDSLTNANAISEHADIPVCLLEYPSNKGARHSNVVPVKSWVEVERELLRVLEPFKK